MLSQEFIDQVKGATSMVALAKKYADLKLVGDGIWQAECPHPNHKDDTPSFIVWEKSESWACMGCHNGKKSIKFKNYGSDCVAFIQWIHNIGWRESIMKLAKDAGIEPEKNKYSELYDHQKRLALSYNRNIPDPVYEYLRRRGVSNKEISDWTIGFDGSRLTFPLIDRYKRTLGFTKRKLKEKEKRSPKYKNSPNSEIFNKSSYLYGIHLIDNDFEEIRITEGSLDVILPHKYGVKNIVATLGTSFTQNHVDMIKNSNKTPVFCMDGDEAGMKSVEKSIDLLSSEGIYSKILLLPKNMDMADLANKFKEETEKYIQDNAITYGQLMIQEVMNQYDAKMNETKLKLYPSIKKILSNIRNEDEQEIIKDYISSRMGLKL